MRNGPLSNLLHVYPREGIPTRVDPANGACWTLRSARRTTPGGRSRGRDSGRLGSCANRCFGRRARQGAARLWRSRNAFQSSWTRRATWQATNTGARPPFSLSGDRWRQHYEAIKCGSYSLCLLPSECWGPRHHRSMMGIGACCCQTRIFSQPFRCEAT
eukprot:3342414-Rhodomonas_salina.1